VASVAVAVERWLCYRRRGGDLRGLAVELDHSLSAGEFQQAIAELERSPAVAASIAAAGLRLARLGPVAVDKAMQSATALERVALEKRLAFLGTLGNNAPFVGLFGTVIGVIKAFEELGHNAPEHAAAAAGAANQVASQAVMTGVAEALVATAVGIAVALPAVAAYNYLQRRVSSLLSGGDVLSNLVLAYLSDSSQPAVKEAA
jgi:biopolymer transport protein ExbB